MSGIRWTTGVGIAVGGLGGALAALMGSPPSSVPASPPAPASVVPASSTLPSALPSEAPPSPAVPAATASIAPNAEPSSLPSSPTPAASVEAVPASPAASASSARNVAAAPSIRSAPPLDVPATREGLLKAEMLCDRKKDVDACGSAALALEQGTTGPADVEQAKRFRRIALTHLVAQCEVDSPHACFVLADKYRAGTELPAKPASAEALERRGLELCRLGRPAPECP